MAKRRNWTHRELLVAFRLYCRTPFGRLHRHNPDIISIAALLNRTPSAVAMKACNFASLDPVQQARNISALGNTSQADRSLWEWFNASPNEVADAAEAATEEIGLQDKKEDEADAEFAVPNGPTTAVAMTTVRRVQSFFRAAVLSSYNYQCALSRISISALINASHIVPWRTDSSRRADPRNGIALNVLYDRAFDRGLLTFDEELRVVISRRLKSGDIPAFQRDTFIGIEGKRLEAPTRFAPDEKALEFHRCNLFDHDA